MSVVQKEELADFAKKLEPLINQISGYALYLLDTSGCVVSWNAGAERLTGYTAEEIIGSHFSAFFTAEDLAAGKPQRALEMASQNKTCQTAGLTVRKDGSRFRSTITVTSFRDQDGRLQGFVNLTYDEQPRGKPSVETGRSWPSTARRLTKHGRNGDFVHRKARLKAAAEVSETGVYDYDHSTRISYWSPELRAMAGLPENSGDISPAQIAGIVHPADRAGCMQAAKAALDPKGIGHFEGECRLLRPDGELRWVKFRGQTFFAGAAHERRALGASGMVIDITKQKQMEEALQASEEKYRTLFDNMTEGFQMGEPILDSAGKAVDHRFLAANKAFYMQTGLPRSVEGRRMRECFPLVEQSWIDRYATIARTAQPAQFEFYNTDTRRHYDIHAFSPSPGRWATLGLDITERKKTEQTLKRSEHRLAMAMEASATAVYEIDVASGSVRGDNRFFTQLGYPPAELVTRDDWVSLIHRNDREAALKGEKEVIAGQRRHSWQELRVRAKDGSWRWITSHLVAAERDAKGWALRLIGTLTDITKRKEAEHALQESEERFRLLYENAPLGITQVDQNARVVNVNRKFSEISGYSQKEAVGLRNTDFSVPEDLERDIQNEAMLLSGPSALHYDRRLLRKDGSSTWVRLTARMICDQTGKPQWGMLLLEDISESKQAEAALRQSEEKFRTTFEHAHLGIAECTLEGNFIEANSKLVEILGYTKEEITHLTVRDITHPSDLEQSLAKLQKLAHGEADFYAMEKRYIRKDRSLVWVNVTKSPSPDHGKPHHLIVTVEDISTRKRTEEDLKRAMEWSYHQANHDRLTGLTNRACFLDRLKEALAYAKRDMHLVALHLLDLDRFKSINDTLGHHIGDLLLKEVASGIKSHVRTTDLVARLGGDEFVVIQTQLWEPEAAGILAGKLVEELGRKYVLENQEVHSSASIGIAVFPNDADNPEDLIKRADLALYEAKHRGRRNYQFYGKELGDAFLEAQHVERELARALRENEFFLHYQPQFDMKSGRMTGVEAFLRWQHPTRGKLEASEFLLDAEHAKLMLPIGEWTVQTACRQHKAWIDAGLSVPLTLNLSATQLRYPRLLETLKRILEETGLPGSMLQLEMREHVLWDPKFSIRLLNQMKESGLRLSLDDFGAEMTALSSLDKFPLDAVKTGRTLVQELPSHPREAAILRAIIGVAHNLRIAVCAGGVETDEEFAALQDQGCDSAQGYWLSSPLDANEMKQLIDVELTH